MTPLLSMLRAGGWLAATTGILALGWARLVPVANSDRPAPRTDSTRVDARRGAYAADSLGRIIVARDPFRFGRRPAATRYDPERTSQPGPAGVAQMPLLRLTGLVLGPAPMALVEGMPGVEGVRVLRVGESVGGLRVTAVRPGQAMIVGRDTTWALTLRRP